MNNYHTEFYNEVRGDEQRIRLGEGCPNNCEYCYSSPELIVYDIPEIVKNKVSIMDMNFLYNPNHKERIKELGSKKINGKIVYYELICGIDWRMFDYETAVLLKQNHFTNIRFAWDYGLSLQYKIKDCYNMLIRAGYKPKDLMCFMLCDWKISFNECQLKLDALKSWNVQVADCWFDNVKPPNFQCNYWNMEECIYFRHLCASHNQLIKFGIYPDLKRAEKIYKKFDALRFQTKLKSLEGEE